MGLYEIVFQWVLLALVTLVVAIRGQLTIFHPVTHYLAFHGMVFAMRPTLIYVGELNKVWDYMEFHPSGELLTEALQITSACLIVFVVAFSLACPSQRIFKMPRFADLTGGEKRALWMTIGLLAPLGLYSVFGANMSGEMTASGVYVMTGTSGYLNDAQRVLIPVCILVAWYFKWRIFSLIPLVVFLGYRFSQGWGRWTILLTMVAIFLVYMWDKRRTWFKGKDMILAGVVGTGIAVGFHELGKNRNAGQEWMRSVMEDTTIEKAYKRGMTSVTLTKDPTKDAEFLKKIDGLDFANFDFLVYIMDKVPEETGKYSQGVQHLQLFTEPIPRGLWKGKPIGPPVPYFDLNDYGNFIGLTVSILGDGWITGGLPGALFNVLMAAVALATLYRFFLAHQTSPFVVFPYLIFCAMLVQFFRDGSLVAMLKFILFTIALPFSMWWFFAKVLLPTPELRPIAEEADEAPAKPVSRARPRRRPVRELAAR
ncbi:MAG: hypothetical protein ACFB20_08395 [Opitutales bacterium]